MKCPVCNNVDLLMSERQGVEIDYCPKCRGVWLDRGELDKIIEREQGGASRYQGETPRFAPEPQHGRSHEEHYNPGHHDERRQSEHHQDRGHGYGKGQGHGHGKTKRKSFFGDLFDFD